MLLGQCSTLWKEVASASMDPNPKDLFIGLLVQPLYNKETGGALRFVMKRQHDLMEGKCGIAGCEDKGCTESMLELNSQGGCMQLT